MDNLLRSDIKKGCSRFFTKAPRPTPKEVFTMLAKRTDENIEADTYGSGELIVDFENEIADMLGLEAALFMPSGTMAQQIMLRISSERKRNKKIAFHQTSHLELCEHKGYSFLHGLESVYLGPQNSLFTVNDLNNLGQDVASLVVEMPQRVLGGVLHPWDDLLKFREWATRTNTHLHLDGARLWESAPYYNKTYKEIGSLFDSVYVSFYKGVRGVTGSILASDKRTIDEARIWLRRHGGNLISLFPYVLSAKFAMEDRLGNMGKYYKKAVSVAATINKIDGVSTFPKVPHTNMMKIHLKGDSEELLGRAVNISKETGVWLFSRLAPSDIDGWNWLEFVVNDFTLEVQDDEIFKMFSSLVN